MGKNLFTLMTFISFVSYGIFQVILFLCFYLCQRSIEDKLSNLSHEKKTIKERIECISPELKKVVFTFLEFVCSNILVYLTGY